MLSEGDELKALAAARPLHVPALAVGAFGGPFTEITVNQVAANPAKSVRFDGVGHYVALEATESLAAAILEFVDGIDER
jgi:pimeloyl-ACP methyl ester carboxylesterase